MNTATTHCPSTVLSTLLEAESFLAWTQDDLDRLLTKLAYPYVDDSNPILHLDELRAKLWAKVAQCVCDATAKGWGG